MSALPLPSPLPADAPKCRHCRRPSSDRKRGLCGPCYHRPEVRALYPGRLGMAGAHGPGTCAHCRKYVDRLGPRRLCERCYLTEDVRRLYPSPRRPQARPGSCRACGKHSGALRPRGLCWSCYYTPGIRARFPSTSKRAGGRGAKERTGNRPLPVPTSALPGSAEKIAVLEERALLGQNLWHPLDARRSEVGTPEESNGPDLSALVNPSRGKCREPAALRSALK